MYNFKVINCGIPEKIFNETCFVAVNDVKYKMFNDSYIPTELKDGIFCCNGTEDENLGIMLEIKTHFNTRRFVEGVDYTINILMSV